MKELPYRQIHLDFHTSPFIKDVGRDFDAEQFVSTLKEAHVNSVNIFAKCHHGMSYYPTKYGKVHPALKFDLFGEMVRVLNREGIDAVAYFTVGWEEYAAEHADWLEVSREGVLGGKPPFDFGFHRWRKLCLNKRGYIDDIIRQTAEIYDLYGDGIKGFWYDIIFQEECVCSDCQRSMKELGLNPQNLDDVRKHDFIVLQRFQKEVFEFVKKCDSEALVYFNGSWRPDGGYESKYSIAELKGLQTHVEIESLPSDLWGYNHFPLFVNYHNRDNSELIGMNGKFHMAWGDLGSLRNQEALEFECFRMIANGSKCSIGDQMHPRASLDPVAYKRIGQIYGQIKEREPWCVGSKKVSQIGVITSNRPLQKHSDADEGVMRMLFELHYTFDFIDVRDDFSHYELLILPDDVRCDAALAAKLSGYAKKGGKLLASHQSGMDPQQDVFTLKELGVEYVRANDYCPSYFVPRQEMLGEGVEQYEYVLYEHGSYVQQMEGAEVLAMLGSSYFNRSYDRFCSHRHTPYDRLTEYPAVVCNGNASYIAHPVFTDYIKNGPRIYRDIVKQLLKKLVPKPFIASDLPSSAEVTIRRQDKEKRSIVHLIHYIAERKARKLDIVDTKLPLYNCTLTIQSPKKPSQVCLAPAGEQLDFIWQDGAVTVKIPKIDGHAMIVLQDAE